MAQQFALDQASPSGDILRLCVHDYMVPEDVTALVAACRDRFERTRQAHGRVLFVVDNRIEVVQSPATTARLSQELLPNYRPGDRIAIVVTSTLNRLQAKRSAQGDFAVFDDWDEALAWLEAAPAVH